MKKIVEKIGRIISALLAIVGVFGCLCECETDNWWIYLIISFAFVVIGFFGFFAFLDLSDTKVYIKHMFKKIEGIWIFVCFSINNTYKDTKEFLSIVKYYRKKNYTYKQIVRMAIDAKRKAVAELNEED